MDKTLDQLRKEIDQIDQQMIQLLAARLRVVKKVGEYKKERNLPALDQNRWQEVLANRLKQAKELNLNENFITETYELIHQEALKIENFN